MATTQKDLENYMTQGSEVAKMAEGDNLSLQAARVHSLQLELGRCAIPRHTIVKALATR